MTYTVSGATLNLTHSLTLLLLSRALWHKQFRL